MSGTPDASKEPAEAVFGRRLREERVARSLSQKDLAALVSEPLLARHGVKLHSSGIARIETGSQTVSLNQAATIAEVLELDLADLLTPSADMDAERALARAEEQLADLESREQMVAAERRIAKTRVDRLRAIVRDQQKD